MRIAKIGREKLYRREYQRDSLEVILGTVGDSDVHDSLSKVLAKMLQG